MRIVKCLTLGHHLLLFKDNIKKGKTVCTRRGRELLIGALLVSIEDFLVELQRVPASMPKIIAGPVL